MRAVLLDRDGVINNMLESGYVINWELFSFAPGARQAVKKLTEAGYRIFVVSNQSGIGKGIYPIEELHRITDNMREEVAKAGGNIEDVFYCVHLPDENCSCRKPCPGLLKMALGRTRGEELESLYMVGDQKTDIEAGNEVGAYTIRITTPEDDDTHEGEPDLVVASLLEAVEAILARDSRSDGGE